MLYSVITQLFGSYSPLVDAEGVVITGIAGVDFAWLAGVFLFAIVLWSFFKLIGGVFKCL